jgi:guanine deaminase
MLRDGVDVRRDSSERGTTDTAIDTVTAFHLATAGGADVLGAPLGRFAVGNQFDAIVVDTAGAVGSALRRWPEVDTEDRLFEKIVRLARPIDITSVWVAGSRVGLPG